MRREVLRTGRVSLERVRNTFGSDPLRGPFLDVGAGDSTYVTELARLGELGVALDPDYAVERPGTDGGGVAGVCEALPFRGDVFRVAHASFVLIHIDDATKALMELVRVTIPNGRVRIEPVWLRRGRVRTLTDNGNVRIICASFLPRRRAAIEVIVGPDGLTVDELQVLVSIVRPGPATRCVARWATRCLIRVQGTNRLDTSRLSVAGALRWRNRN
jgi:SAM-dependent methyltransferase